MSRAGLIGVDNKISNDDGESTLAQVMREILRLEMT